MLAAKALIPEPKSVRRAKATSAAAIRSISRAKSAIDKRPTMPIEIQGGENGDEDGYLGDC